MAGWLLNTAIPYRFTLVYLLMFRLFLFNCFGDHLVINRNYTYPWCRPRYQSMRIGRRHTHALKYDLLIRRVLWQRMGRSVYNTRNKLSILTFTPNLVWNTIFGNRDREAVISREKGLKPAETLSGTHSSCISQIIDITPYCTKQELDSHEIL